MITECSAWAVIARPLEPAGRVLGGRSVRLSHSSDVLGAGDGESAKRPGVFAWDDLIAEVELASCGLATRRLASRSGLSTLARCET